MKYSNCTTCGKEKLTLKAQTKALCKSCAQKGNTHGTANKGQKYSPMSDEGKKNIGASQLGKSRPCSEERRYKISIAKGGTGEHHRYPGVNRWAALVRKRDGHKCAECGYQGTPGKRDVDAHHVLWKCKYPEYSTVLFNGVTLCKPCHAEEHR